MKKKLEQRVAQNEQKYRALADKFVDIVWVLNAETMTYLYISENILGLTDFTPDELIGKPIKNRITSESFAKIELSIKEALAGFQKGENKSYNIEIKVLESLLPICSGCRRIRDADNHWWPIEKYVEEHAGSKFTHTICQDCSDVYYRDPKSSDTKGLGKN